MNRFKVAGLSLFFLCVIVLLTGGCATTPSTPTDPRMVGYGTQFNVRASSFAVPDVSPENKTYYITSALQNVNDYDLQFLEFARYVENALSQKGYTRIENKEEADLLVRLAYGIGSPKTMTNTYTTSSGYSYPVGWMWFTVPPTTETVTETTYLRTLVLEAYDLKDPNRRSQIWKTTVQSEGSMSDLRIVLAYMIAASSEHFGTNTGKQLELTIPGDDSRVLDIWK